jgi:hypothetical protein
MILMFYCQTYILLFDIVKKKFKTLELDTTEFSVINNIPIIPEFVDHYVLLFIITSLLEKLK